MVPLTVHFGSEQLRDGVDIDAPAFYERLRAGGPQPTTSQPSPADFTEAYRGLLATDDDRVLSVHLGAGWSGTLSSATLAARDFGDRVACVDSLTVSMGMQLLLLATLRDIGEGCDLATAVSRLKARRARAVIYVLLDTLSYLQRGGRIGRAQAFLGSVLNVKPLLRVAGGEIHPQARVRNRAQGLSRLAELVAAEAPVEALGTLAGGAPDLADQVKGVLEGAHPGVDVTSGWLGPVVGTYTGPDSVGVAALRAER